MYTAAKLKFLKNIRMMVQKLDEEPLIEALRTFLSEEPPLQEIYAVMNACNDGIACIMEMYERGQYNVGDIICAREMMMEIEDVLKPFAKEVLIEEQYEICEKEEESLVEEILSLACYSKAVKKTAMQ